MLVDGRKAGSPGEAPERRYEWVPVVTTRPGHSGLLERPHRFQGPCSAAGQAPAQFVTARMVERPAAGASRRFEPKLRAAEESDIFETHRVVNR